MILAYFGGYTAKELFFVVFYKIGVLSAFQIFKNDTLPFVIPHGFCAGYNPFFWLFFCRERALSLDLFFFFLLQFQRCLQTQNLSAVYWVLRPCKRREK